MLFLWILQRFNWRINFNSPWRPWKVRSAARPFPFISPTWFVDTAYLVFPGLVFSFCFFFCFIIWYFVKLFTNFSGWLLYLLSICCYPTLLFCFCSFCKLISVNYIRRHRGRTLVRTSRIKDEFLSPTTLPSHCLF